MIKESKVLSIINSYLMQESTPQEVTHLPVSADMLYHDKKLCNALIDFLGDIYVYMGLDAEYKENTCGEEIQEAICFLAYCSEKTRS